jgi:hypothetical protein
MLLNVLTITLSASVPNHKERNTANCHPFDTHVLFDTSFFSKRFVIKHSKKFLLVYMMGTLSLSIVSPQIEKRRDSIHLLLESRRDVTPTL